MPSMPRVSGNVAAGFAGERICPHGIKLLRTGRCRQRRCMRTKSKMLRRHRPAQAPTYLDSDDFAGPVFFTFTSLYSCAAFIKRTCSCEAPTGYSLHSMAKEHSFLVSIICGPGEPRTWPGRPSTDSSIGWSFGVKIICLFPSSLFLLRLLIMWFGFHFPARRRNGLFTIFF
jgi:hypothetical protein